MKYFPIKDLKRADYNPRVMPPEEMESLMRSIETHGFVEPIVVNVAKDRYGIIVGGHQRLTAVEKLLAKDILPKGIEPKAFDSDPKHYQYSIPCFEVQLTEEAEKQLNIGLNKIHGKFEEEKLFDLIDGMRDSPTILSTGFSAAEISSILDQEGDGEKHTPGVDAKTECARCLQLKLEVLGHTKRTGHVIEFPEAKEENK